MSVYRHKDPPFYHYDFQLRGHRFHGSTGAKGKREAEGVERTEKARAKKHLEQASRAKVSLRIDDVADRYWLEVGQHHAGRDNTERDLARLIEYFGKDRLLTEIDDDDVAELVAWRRGHTRRGAARAPLIAPATVNRSTTEVLKKLFKAAKVQPEPDWKRIGSRSRRSECGSCSRTKPRHSTRRRGMTTARSWTLRTPPACG
jgi:hypothetical protein